MRTVLLLLICAFFIPHLKAQQADTIYVADSISNHSPSKATVMSLVVPGLGQAYNKKYWKIPLIYAAIGSAFYFARRQHQDFDNFKDAYIKRIDDDPATIDDKYQGVYSDENLLSLIDFHRENRDLLYVLTAVAYILNVVDAAVDAHLYNFNVSDDLSATIRPTLQISPIQAQPIPSLGLTLKIGKKPAAGRF